jgi:hypothetical protein
LTFLPLPLSDQAPDSSLIFTVRSIMTRAVSIISRARVACCSATRMWRSFVAAIAAINSRSFEEGGVLSEYAI